MPPGTLNKPDTIAPCDVSRKIDNNSTHRDSLCGSPAAKNWGDEGLLKTVINLPVVCGTDSWPRVLTRTERTQILLSSKTSANILNFDPNIYDIEMQVKDAEWETVYRWKFRDCRKEFYKPQNFVVHLKMHVGIKNYECSYCHKTFTQKGNMRKHMRTHNVNAFHRRPGSKCKTFCKLLVADSYDQIKFTSEMRLLYLWFFSDALG